MAKVTLSTRVAALETMAKALQYALGTQNQLIEDLTVRVGRLDDPLSRPAPPKEAP